MTNNELIRYNYLLGEDYLSYNEQQELLLLTHLYHREVAA